MKRFAYVCADPGIPIPGTKGSSGHVASLCRAFVDRGLDGEVFAARRADGVLSGLPVLPIAVPKARDGESVVERETRYFFAGLDSPIANGRDYDFVYERYSLWHVGGLRYARKLRVPFVLEVNSPLPDEAGRFRRLEQEQLARGLARCLMRGADGVVCVSSAVAEWVADLRGEERGVWVVPNGVDARLFSPPAGAAPRAWPQGPGPVVVFCGSFRPWHGVDDLAEAFRIVVHELVPDAHLLCIGDGPAREGFERKIREAGLAERVHVTGSVPQTEVPLWLRGADVAVAPYPPLESFYFSPLKLFEFMAMGLPVVGAAVGQVEEVLQETGGGLTYRPGDVRALATGIGRLLADAGAAERAGRRGRDWVLAHATWSERARQILDRIGEGAFRPRIAESGR